MKDSPPQTVLQSEAQLRLLVAQVPAVIWTTDKNLKYTSIGGAGLAALNLGPSDLIGKHATSTGKAGSPEVDTVLQAHQRALSGESVAYQTRWADSFFEGYIEPLRGADGEIDGCVGVALDITERVRSQQLLEQRVTQAHDLAVLHERQRLARELHDSVTQSLYSLSLMAEAARRLVSAGNIERGAGYLARIGESAQQVLKEMRLLVYELRPLILERDGLANALKQRLEAVEDRTGVKTSLIVEGDGLVPEHIEAELYRIALEALNNSLKHSRASSVSVRLCTTPEEVTLAVIDDGRGFLPGTVVDKGGLGLVSMQERTQRLGGRLDVASGPGQGASITVYIPFGHTEES